MSEVGIKTSTWRADIQGVRALAVLTVCAYHSDFWFSRGYLGVDVFMVVSGYVMTSLVAREWIYSGRGFSLTKFLTRRARRLIPALIIVVSGTWLIYLVLAPAAFFRNTIVQGVTSLLSVSNLYFLRRTLGYFEIEPSGDPLLHTWSLGVEEQFYLLMGVSVVLLKTLTRWRERWRPKFIAGLSLGVACFVSVFLYWLLVSERCSLSRVFYSRMPSSIAFLLRPDAAHFYLPLARAWQFGLGAIGALLLFDRRLKMHSKYAELGTIAFLLAVLSGYLTFGSVDGIETDRILVTVTTAFLLTRSSKRILSSRLLVWIGDRSYSLYLWHYPLLSASKFLGGIPASKWLLLALALGLSELTFRFVESPYFRRRNHIGSESDGGSRSIVRTPEAKVLLVGFAVLAVVGLSLRLRVDILIVGEAQNPRDYVRESQIWLTQNGCLSDDNGLVRCGSLLESEIVLIGDSHAWSVAPGFIEATRSLGIPSAVRSQAGCPIYESISLSAESTCQEFYSTLKTEFADGNTKTIMLVSCARFKESCPEGIRSGSVDQLVKETHLALTDLVSRDMTVLLPGQLPILSVEPPSQGRSLLQRLVPDFFNRLPLDKKKMDISRRFQQDLSAALVASGFEVATGDLFHEACDSETCASRGALDAKQLFKDNNHFTLAGSIHQTPSIIKWLSSVFDDEQR